MYVLNVDRPKVRRVGAVPGFAGDRTARCTSRSFRGFGVESRYSWRRSVRGMAQPFGIYKIGAINAEACYMSGLLHKVYQRTIPKQEKYFAFISDKTIHSMEAKPC